MEQPQDPTPSRPSTPDFTNFRLYEISPEELREQVELTLSSPSHEATTRPSSPQFTSTPKPFSSMFHTQSCPARRKVVHKELPNLRRVIGVPKGTFDKCTCGRVKHAQFTNCCKACPFGKHTGWCNSKVARKDYFDAEGRCIKKCNTPDCQRVCSDIDSKSCCTMCRIGKGHTPHCEYKSNVATTEVEL